ncbi:uncharacterized protein LOC109812963 [Cajanus cajan]|nr:uncharacterized protein LOC109812963 [Cajanus cajan]
MNLDDTILQLKDKISMMKTRQKLKLQEMSVRLKSGEELHDHCSLRDCGMLNISHVYVHKTLPQQPRLSSAAFGPKMLKLMVVLKGGTHKIPIEVNSLNRVEELKFELEKFHKHLLPENGRYFFTYQKKGYVMSDTHAFSWYMIEDGDTIQITPQQE